MWNNLYLYIVLALIVAAIIASFQYLYKNKDKSLNKYILFTLRFSAVFLLLLLLINPKIKKEELQVVKPNLIVLVDNTKSISKLKQDKIIANLASGLQKNKVLQKKFELVIYPFSDDILPKDTLDFKRNSTNIYKALKSVNKIYKKSVAPIVLITDGNQTQGNDYASINLNQKVYPLIVGDTTVYEDIRISQFNVNKYAYLKNKFPIEIFVNYKGTHNITSKLKVTEGSTTIFSKNIILDKNITSEKIDFFINANKVGTHHYKISLSPINNEKNKLNNRKDFTIEVINEQSKIAIISDIMHPDIAMFKRAIESNKQRKVSILKTSKLTNVNDYQLFILYQPTVKFIAAFKKMNELNKNFLIVTGKQTDWNFLNNSQNYFNKKVINNSEDYLAIFNPSYTTFLTENLGFDNFQPLTDYFGKVTFSVPYQSILFQQIGNSSTQESLLATFEQNNRRGAVLFGENSWRWRMSSKIEANSFQPFDGFMNKLVQYLASNKKANFLEVSNKSYYYKNETIQIKAKPYDANYTFNPNAKLWITVINNETKKRLKYPFALQNNNYSVAISDLEQGNYSFTVFNELNKSSSNGKFSILDYNIEEQFVNANKSKLEKIASNSGTKVYYPQTIETLITNLSTNKSYVSIQKSKEIVTPLIDWKWIMGAIILLLSIEWFIRKYKGYI
jgi:hypothetical protein